MKADQAQTILFRQRICRLDEIRASIKKWMGGEVFIFGRAVFQCFAAEFGELFRQWQIGIGFAEIIVDAGKPFRQRFGPVNVIF